jgi:hypothetical protein
MTVAEMIEKLSEMDANATVLVLNGDIERMTMHVELNTCGAVIKDGDVRFDNFAKDVINTVWIVAK